MPALRAHMVFLVKLRQALERDLPDLRGVGQAVAAEWPAALLGCEAPDSHYFTEQTRPDLHMLDKEDPATWAGAVERWLDAHPELAPGRVQPAATVAFVAGYLSHLGLDTWAEQYLHSDFPPSVREGLPPAWYPAALADPRRRQAALRQLAEQPVPPEFFVERAALEHAPVPAGFRADAIRASATGILPALSLDDPWAQSRVQAFPGRVLRPDTPEEHQRWAAARAAQTPATPEEVAALVTGAIAFTAHMIRRWW